MKQIKQFLQQKGKSSEEQDNPTHIHLEKVVIYPSNPSQPVGAIVWRGKLSSVDGFSIGRGYLYRVTPDRYVTFGNDTIICIIQR